MSKLDKIKKFDPNNLGDSSSNIFGLPFTCEEADVVIVPVPWDVTVSYSDGTINGPSAVFNASFQVDLYDPSITDAWKLGIAMEEISNDVKSRAELLRTKAKVFIAAITNGIDTTQDADLEKDKALVNAGSEWMNAWVKQRCLEWMNKGKLVALLGGDHSTPFGMLQALAEKYPAFAILQIDAHADLRPAFEGFTYSHASIMYNALTIPQVSKIVQVGIRDFCQQEAELIQNSNGRIKTFFDRDIKQDRYLGKNWSQQVQEIIAELPEEIYISFDIDGLDPKLCPNTGTPVAGGFEFEEIAYLIQEISKSGKKIIAVDLNEVATGANDEWDANVGARMLYRMCNLMALSNGRF
ncbi:MAG: agmatinase family protein [Bacteroidetes bacterium]|nr:agmatinase family protein [Bacteroidota bacterium]PHX82652.1 MAG: agmatinase [Flavobacteriales bacterium]